MTGANQHIRQLLGWLGDRDHQLRLALEAADLGTWHCNLSTGETFWSERCRAFLGVAPHAPASLEVLLGRVHADDRAGLLQTIEDSKRSGATCSKEFRVLWADGAVRWLHSIGRVRQALRPGGALIMSGVIRDVTDARTAGALAERRRQYLRELLHEAPTAAAKLDRELQLLAVNPRFVDDLRLGPQRLIGRALFEVLPEARSAWQAVLQRCLGGTPQRGEVEALARTDGTTDWVSARALPWYDDAGKIGGAVLLVEVRTQERLWAGAFDHNIHGLAISDPDSMTYRSVNVAYAGLLGYRPEELQGRAIRTQYVGSEYDKLRQAVAQADATGSASVETLQLHRDGTPVPVLLDLVSLRDAQGRVVHRISTISDLRERRRTEAQLRRSEAQHLIDQRFQLVAESAPIGILLTDDAGLVSYANPVWLGIAGLSLEQARGSNPLEFVHPDDRERVRADWDRIGGRDGLDLEFRYLRPGGESRWVHSHSTAMRHTAGALLGCVHASLDITDALRERRARERTHSQVRALARRLEQLRALERAELADTLQKQFYESLAALKDGLATLRASAADPRALERLLGQAEAAQERLRRVVFDLRPPDIEELGFAAAIERYATELGAQWGLQIELSLPREPPAVPAYVLAVLYDAAREALGNVARHARATRASVAVAVNAGGISLRVSDDGIGMGEHEHHKPGCFGLLRAAERLAGIGGTLRTLGVAGSGTVVQASVPLAEHGRQGPSAGTSGSEGRGSSA